MTTTNTATITNKNGESWTGTAEGTGIGVPKTTVTKTGAGVGVKGEDGTVSVKWSGNVTYDEALVKDEYTITDTIGSASSYLWYGWDGWYDYQVYHYGIAAQINKDLEESFQIKVKDGNTEKILSYAQVKDYVTFRFGGSGNTAATDETTHIRKFTITIKGNKNGNGIQPLEVSFTYRTVFDTEYYAEGTKWRVHNRLSAESVNADSYQYYSVMPETDGSIDKQVRITAAGRYGTGVWVDGSHSFDYDQMNGQLTYRLLASPAQIKETDEAGNESIRYAETLTVTDTLPEGFTIVEGSVKVGSYNANTTTSSYGWTENEHVSIVYPSDSNGNVLRVDFKNIGTDLTLTAANLVMIEYTVQIDEHFAQLEGAEITNDGQSYTASKVFTNIAANGGKTASVDTTVTRSLSVLDKAGEQILANGANTNTVHYTVDVNPEALDLLEGGDTLTLTDTMTSDALDFSISSSREIFRMCAAAVLRRQSW